MVTKSKAFLYLFAVSLLGVAFGAWRLHRYQYPFGATPCAVQCMISDLRGYARKHDGWFPNVENDPMKSLVAFYQEYPSDANLLAGLSGDKREVRRRLESGEPLDSNIVSWVYVPGLRIDSDPPVAIIWERQAGLRWNGKRGVGHAVGFSDGFYPQIRPEKWESFLREQEDLRQKAAAEKAKDKPSVNAQK